MVQGTGDQKWGPKTAPHVGPKTDTKQRRCSSHCCDKRRRTRARTRSSDRSALAGRRLQETPHRLRKRVAHVLRAVTDAAKATHRASATPGGAKPRNPRRKTVSSCGRDAATPASLARRSHRATPSSARRPGAWKTTRPWVWSVTCVRPWLRTRAEAARRRASARTSPSAGKAGRRKRVRISRPTRREERGRFLWPGAIVLGGRAPGGSMEQL